LRPTSLTMPHHRPQAPDKLLCIHHLDYRDQFSH
jgi:hypothetical protein